MGTVGSLFFAAGGLWWVAHVGATPDYLGAYLPGSLLGGFGVGLMLPSLGGAATAPLPPQRFATGSALYAMSRQIGVALGVACLVAILGSATGAAAVDGLPPRLDLHDRAAACWPARSSRASAPGSPRPPTPGRWRWTTGPRWAPRPTR